MLSPSVERWREIAELERGSTPADLLLAIVALESGGQAGIRARYPTKPAQLPKRDGSIVTVSHAFGLMQVTPLNYLSLSGRITTRPIAFEDIAGTDMESARIQIRAGRSILENAMSRLNARDPKRWPWPKTIPSDDQILLALAIYAVGYGPIGQALDKLQTQGIEPSFRSLARVYPHLGEPKNRPIAFARAVYGLYQRSPIAITKGRDAAIFALLIGAIAWRIFKKGVKRK